MTEQRATAGAGAVQAKAAIASLSLRDFRNFSRLDLEVPDAGVALVGDNGQGKTNLLEAIYYLSLFRSIRGARDADLIGFGQSALFAEAAVRAPGASSLAVGYEAATRRKRVRRDGVVVTRLSDALGTLPVVMFAPIDVELLVGGPGARRRFLDIMLAVSSRGYLDALQQYRAALARRNAALRETSRRGRDPAGVTVWNEPLAVHGAALSRARRAWVEQAREPFAERVACIGESGVTELRYASGTTRDFDDSPESLRAVLDSRQESDVRFGVTQFGPHRDDVVVSLDGRDLRTFGSAGQQRTAAIALRSVEADTVRIARGAAPVFLLDDPFAELDADRAARVLALLQGAHPGQTVLAVPRDADIPAGLTELPRRRVVRGTVA